MRKTDTHNLLRITLLRFIPAHAGICDELRPFWFSFPLVSTHAPVRARRNVPRELWEAVEFQLTRP